MRRFLALLALISWGGAGIAASEDYRLDMARSEVDVTLDASAAKAGVIFVT